MTSAVAFLIWNLLSTVRRSCSKGYCLFGTHSQIIYETVDSFTYTVATIDWIEITCTEETKYCSFTYFNKVMQKCLRQGAVYSKKDILPISTCLSF